MTSSIITLYPVISLIPEQYCEKSSGREKVAFLQKMARKALAYSAKKR